VPLPPDRVTALLEEIRAVDAAGVPAVLRDVGPLFEVAEVFAWIKAVHPAERPRDAAKKLRALKADWGVCADLEDPSEDLGAGRPAELYRDGALILDPSPYLPSGDHPNFETWVADTRAALGGHFGMQAPGLESASFDALARLQTLVAPVLSRTGPRTYRFNAFLGDYPQTPFGFHVDPHQEGVFQYQLVGRRRGSFWDALGLSERDTAWLEDSNGLTPPPREPDVCLDLEPGDLVFWPGTHVHGFEAESPSMALSIVVERASPMTRAEVVKALEVRSMGGYASRPPVDENAYLEPGAALRRRGVFPLAFGRHDDTLVIAVCGRSFEWPEKHSIGAAIRLLEALDELPLGTEGPSAEAWIERFADPTLPDGDISELLALLLAWGFFH